jgi:hypothetical protein
MKALKYITGLALLLAFSTGCKKTTYEDVSFVSTAAAPDQLNVLFEITQDNTGLVTITPNGAGAVKYDVYYGHGGTTPVKVLAGKNTTHTYPEGVYTVKIVGYSVNGKTTELTKQLTVSFRAPENLDVTTAIDASSNFKLNVSATALYETNFRVFFGDVPNEVGLVFLEGQTVSHTYTAVGTYTVKVVAYSGGAATTQVTRQITIVDPLLLPITFESPTINYAFSNFDGGNATVVANPQANGINTSAKVGKMVKGPGGQVWGGSWIGLSSPIDFSVNKVFRMKVWSPRAGAKVLLKVENGANTAQNFEKEATTSIANGWEDLVFDYNGINTANPYNHIVLIFELGTVGDGSANYTFYFDDIRLVNTVPITLPLNFEHPVTYGWTIFDGGDVTVIANPQSAGINTSAKVARMIKNAGQPWGGSFLTLAGPIDFSVNKTFKMKVWSPRVGAKVLLKVENSANPGQNYEKEVLTTVANGWEELTFDYTAINTANNYDRIVIIFDNGTMGDGTANFTFFFDDIKLV